MKNSNVVLGSFIFFAVFGNALCMHHRPWGPWGPWGPRNRATGPPASSSSSSSDSDKDNSASSGPPLHFKDMNAIREFIKKTGTREWKTTSANIRGTNYGPARVKYGGSGITMYDMKTHDPVDRIHTIKGYICEGKTVTVMDQAGVNNRFTFRSEADAQEFDKIIHCDP